MCLLLCFYLWLYLYVFVVLVFEDVAPDDLHVMKNGVMYAIVNKNKTVNSTDGKSGTPTSPDGRRDTHTSPDGRRDTPTSPDGRRDTPTSPEGRVSKSRRSGGNDGYEEVDIDFVMAKQKGSHLVASNARLVWSVFERVDVVCVSERGGVVWVWM